MLEKVVQEFVQGVPVEDRVLEELGDLGQVDRLAAGKGLPHFPGQLIGQPAPVGQDRFRRAHPGRARADERNDASLLEPGSDLFIGKLIQCGGLSDGATSSAVSTIVAYPLPPEKHPYGRLRCDESVRPQVIVPLSPRQILHRREHLHGAPGQCEKIAPRPRQRIGRDLCCRGQPSVQGEHGRQQPPDALLLVEVGGSELPVERLPLRAGTDGRGPRRE
jgi:hypothetical protein